MRFFPKTLTRDESAAFIARLEEAFERDGYGFFAVVRKDSGETIGACGLFKIQWQAHFTPAVEVGWRFLKEHWGQGFATEAAQASVNHGWERGLQEIVALAVPGNIPSHRVMERIGMKRDLGGDFLHPRLEQGHPLQLHWLWRLKRPT